MSSHPGPLSVDIWFDVACPWCYLGKHRFDTAVTELAEEVRVEYHSFELAPDTPVDFEGSEVDFLVGYKRMPRDRVVEMLARMTELGAQEGLRYDFAALRHTRTLLAHQLAHHAKTEGRQPELVERLFRGYFAEGRHLGRVDVLVELAAESGLDGAPARQALTEGRYAGAIASDIEAARRIGVTGVPYFMIDGRYGMSGAQNRQVFASALRRVRRVRATDSEPAGGHR